MPDRPRHVLVFEPDGRGHAEEWLSHILRHACDAPTPIRVTLAIADTLVPPLSTLIPRGGGGRVTFVPLDAGRCRACIDRPLTRAAFARWHLMRDCLDRSGADEGIFLTIDLLSLPLALGHGMGGRRVDGVLFRPSVHYRALGDTTPTLAERVRDARKRILYARMLRNPALARVLSLDPYFAAVAHREFRHGDKVVALADPAAVPAGADDLPKAPSPFPPDRTALLMFGELTERKGILPLLDACALVDARTAARAAVLIAGRIAPELRAVVGDRVAALRVHRPELWIALDDRRLPTDELMTAVAACDIVLAPYQRFVGSSGVLVWAARFARPVITQSYGLLGRLVADYSLGLAIDTMRPQAIADALAASVDGAAQHAFDATRASAFVQGHSGATFAAQVLGMPDSQADSACGRSPDRLAGTTA